MIDIPRQHSQHVSRLLDLETERRDIRRRAATGDDDKIAMQKLPARVQRHVEVFEAMRKNQIEAACSKIPKGVVGVHRQYHLH